MEDINKFIEKFGGITEVYKFYGDSVTLRYDVKNHVYLLEKDSGELEEVPAVTSICHILDKSSALIPWACKQMSIKILGSITPDTYKALDYEQLERIILDGKTAHKDKLEDAGNVGHIAHKWIEGYIKDEIAGLIDFPHPLPDNEQAKSCCIAAVKWMKDHNVRWISSEQKVYSKSLKYAGTLDGKAIVDSCSNIYCCPDKFTGRMSLIDWKTSNYLYLEYLLQTAAYEFADEEEKNIDIKDRWVIQLSKDDGKFNAWHLEADRFEEDFKGFKLCLELLRTKQSIDNRIKDLKDKRKQYEKELREERLLIKCKNADKYKGIRKPTCNHGNPCQSCLAKYKEKHAT